MSRRSVQSRLPSFPQNRLLWIGIFEIHNLGPFFFSSHFETPLVCAVVPGLGLSCILSVTTRHGEEQEMGAREQFIRGGVEDNFEGTAPTFSCVAAESEAFNRDFQGARGASVNQPQKSRGPKGPPPKPPVSQASPVTRLSPDERVADARAHVARLEAALQVLGEDSVEAQPIKEALKKAREQTRVLSIGERLDSTLKFIQRSRARIEKIQADLSREQSLLQGALENLERLRDEAGGGVSPPPSDGCRGSRGRASKVEGGSCRLARTSSEARSGREKARVLPTPSDLAPFQPAGAGSASDMMLTLIDAADSTLREARA